MKRTSSAAPERYRAFLVRMWRIETGEAWRVSVEGVGDDQRRGFPDLDAAFTFLQHQLSATPKGGEEDAPDETT